MANKGYALHIGINKVDPSHYTKMQRLNCCVNDAKEMSALSTALKFEKIETLFNERATTVAFEQLMNTWSKELSEGDLLWITYSGHGGTKPDSNEDETDENDKWDETWCMYDREILDDELFASYQRFGKGVRILIFSDSCHSGTVARAMLTNQPLPEDIFSQEWEEFKLTHNAKSRRASFEGCFERYIKFRDIYEEAQKKGSGQPESSINPYVVQIGACKDNQESIEFGAHGYFTSVLLDIFKTPGSLTDYDTLLNTIRKADIGKHQNVSLYHYGNPNYKFLHHFPLSVSGKPIEIPAAAKKKAERVDQDDARLIVHEKAGSRGDGNEEIIHRSLIAEPVEGNTAWDRAYQLHKQKNTAFIEPDLRSKFIGELFAKGDSGNDYLSTWPKPSGDNEFLWHLDDQHSELRKAAEEVAKKYNGETSKLIRIAHIDTGWRNHITKPEFLNTELGKSFINGSKENDTEDKLKSGFPAEQDGHGCATLALLAGNKVTREQTYSPYDGFFGAIPFAEVVPIRICETVYNLFNANDVADAIDHAVETECEVITMSMAGYPTRAVADAVNRAYEKGVVIVTAAGNNWYEGIQKLAPKSVLYPARFQRVIAATGACFDHAPYDNEAPRETTFRTAGGEVMQGNWGPEAAMKYAVAAYTPNLPWASLQNGLSFLRSGGGTSSATPQVAAAAALWIVYNRDQIAQKKLNGSQKVEAARKALFSSASKTYKQYKKYYGNGIIRAHKALTAFKFTDEEIAKLGKAREAKVSFTGIIPFIAQWFRSRSGDNKDGGSADAILSEMVATEILQVIHRDPELMEYAENFDSEVEEGSFLEDEEARRIFFAKLNESPFASDFLKQLAGTAAGNEE